MNRKTLTEKNRDRGFTLVELIVVLVILAILAAILIPALLGYIDRARQNKDILNAKNCLTAAQAELVNIYAKKLSTETDSVIPDCASTGNGNKDVDCTLKEGGKEFAKRVFKTADDEPYCFIIAMGTTKPDSTNPPTEHDKYTVYYALYMKEATSSPLYFDGQKWAKENPKNMGTFSGEKTNVMTLRDGRKIEIQYYMLASAGGKKMHGGSGNTSIWDWLRKTVGKDDGK